MVDFRAFVESADEERDETSEAKAAAAPEPTQSAVDAAAPSMWNAVNPAISNGNALPSVPRARPSTGQARTEKTAQASSHTKPLSEETSVTFPVGWLVVIEGPDRGACLTLQKGVSRIDRTDAGAFTLATAASERSFATIVYDTDKNEFFVGEPDDVFPTKPLDDGDTLSIGNSQLRFVALCNASFDWANDSEGAQ